MLALKEHELTQASFPSEIVATPQQGLFDTMLQSAWDAWDMNKIPETGKQQSDGKQSHKSILASTSREPAKNEGTDLLLVGAELTAAALLIRFGLKQLAKNGINVIGEAEKLAKGVGFKFNTKPTSFTPVRTSDLPINSAGSTNTFSLPTIRTTQRDLGSRISR